MRAIGRWLARTLGSAVAIVLIIVLLPYASNFAKTLLPDLSGAALTDSATLSHELRGSARLETSTVSEEGVITSSTKAFLIGEVQSVAIKYDYSASIGIDLSRVQLRVDGSKITFLLPDPEILSDNLTPNYDESSINDFWFELTDERRQQLLDDERLARRANCLDEAVSGEQSWQNTVAVFENHIAKWISAGNSRVTFDYVRASSDNPR